MSGNIYVTAALKSNVRNQAYIFMRNEYVLEDYAPNTRSDIILKGPLLIGDGFPCLKNTVFEKQGIDSAFASHNEGESYIFSGNMCAKWLYAPSWGASSTIIDGPKPIAEMFPYFKGTVFEHGVDAAFESSRRYEAYLFKGENYARINYSYHNRHLFNLAPIRRFWPCLCGTIYESGFDAAFTLHSPDDEAYLFKGVLYACLKFSPGTTNDQLRWSGDIKGAWPNLGSFLPRKPVSRLQQPQPNNNSQPQVATSISITNETRTGTLNFEDSKDWFGYNTRKGGYPRTIEDNQTRKFTHQGKVDGKKYGSMGAVIYVGPGEVRGDSNDCGWLVAWHVPGNNNQNHVYVDTGYSDKFDDIDWDGIQYKLQKTGTSQQYIDPHSKTGVYARIPNSGNKKTYDLNVSFRAGGR